MVDAAVALGVLLNLVAFETIGLTAGGMVVPGYLALFWDQPSRVAATFGLAFLTWVFVTGALRRWILLYGRRRYAAVLVVGMLFNWALTAAAPSLSPAVGDLRGIGFLLPGLIANEMERQGVLTTAAVTIGIAAVVRLLLAVAISLGA